MSTDKAASLLARVEKLLNNYGLSSRIVGLSFLPIVMLVLLSATQAYWSYKEYLGNKNIAQLASVSVSINDVLYQLQREAGYSAIFFASEGGDDARDLLIAQGKSGRGARQQLIEQHRISDEAINALKSALSDVDASAFDAEFAAKISTAQSQLDAVKAIRQFVLTLDFMAEKIETERIASLSFVERQMMPARVLPVDKMSNDYATVSSALLDIIKAERAYVADAETAQQIASLLALLEIMERAGQERALVASGFSAKSFTVEEYVQFLNLLGQQDALISVFRAAADARVEQLFDEKMDSEIKDLVEEIRFLVVDLEGDSLDGSGYTDEEWYEAASGKIDLIKEVTDDLSTEIIGLVSTKAESAFVNFILFIVGIIFVGFLVIFSVGVSRSVAGPLTRLNETMVKLAEGNLDIDVPCVDYGSEMGSMAKAVENFKVSNIERLKLEEEAKRAEEDKRARDESRRQQEEKLKQDEQQKELNIAHEREARAKRLEERITAFDNAIIDQINFFNEAISKMETTAVSMSEIARQTEMQSVAAAEGAAQTSSNVLTVSSATEEVSSSVSEISQQMEHSSSISNAAIKKVDITTDTASNLAESSKNIGNVISLINEIAEQTNLLALNATIEAARAGDAGLGFAVVASEVKELANQTSSATNEIAEQIKQVQLISDKMVATIKETKAAIQENAEVALSVNAATEEQSYATREILQNIQKAAKGTESVTSQITQVKDGAAAALAASEQVQGSSQRLAETSGTLKKVIEEFLADIRNI